MHATEGYRLQDQTNQHQVCMWQKPRAECQEVAEALKCMPGKQ